MLLFIFARFSPFLRFFGGPVSFPSLFGPAPMVDVLYPSLFFAPTLIGSGAAPIPFLELVSPSPASSVHARAGRSSG